MLRVTAMNKYQAFRWLWRFDNEAKWFWFRCFIMRADLQQCVRENLRDFGVVKRVCFYQIKKLKLQLSNQLEF